MRSNKQQKKKEIKMTSTNLILTVILRLQSNLQFPNKLRPTYEMVLSLLREGTFSIGEGGWGWARAPEGRVINKFLQIGKGQTCFICNRGKVTVFFGKGKITPCRLADSSLSTNTRSL